MTNESTTPRLSDEESLIQFLESRDVNCPACGYNLRQLRSPKCPECGEGVRLSVGLTDQRIGTWVACLIGCCLPATFGCFALVFVVPYFIQWGMAGAPFQVTLTLVYIIAMIPAVIVLLFHRQRFLRMLNDRQIILAVAPWVMNVATVVMMVMGNM